MEDRVGVNALIEVELVAAHDRDPFGFGVDKELGIDGGVNRIERPLRAGHQVARHRGAVIADHAHGGAVYQARSTSGALGDVAGHGDVQGGRGGAQGCRERLGPGQIAFHEPELGEAEGEKSEGHRLADATGADHADRPWLAVTERVGVAGHEARPVGIIALGAVRFEDHGVDRAEGCDARIGTLSRGMTRSL